MKKRIEFEVSNDKLYAIHIKIVLFIIVFILLIEGALRKWAFPQLSQPLYFLKDFFVVYLYFYLYSRNKFPKNSILTLFFFFMGAFYLLMSFQALFLDYNFFVGLYGWRNYCLYTPLAFVIAEYTDWKELKRIARLLCFSSWPMAILAFIQYNSPPDNYINKNVGVGNTMEIFKIADGIVRPSASFSFTTGLAVFTNVIFMMLVLNFFLKRDKFLNKWQFIITCFTFLTCLAVCGSRSAYASTFIMFGGLFLASLLLLRKKEGFQIIAYSSIALLIGFLAFNFVFEQQRDLILKRQESASASEGSIVVRALANFIDLNAILESDITLTGVGIGLGSGGGSFLASGIAGFGLAETEWGRHILEAGLIMGFMYILFRVLLCFNVMFHSFKAFSNTSNPTPIVFMLFIIMNLLIGPITGNGISYGFTWIFLGYAMAINKIFSDPSIGNHI